jgi:hypothetical protein
LTFGAKSFIKVKNMDEQKFVEQPEKKLTKERILDLAKEKGVIFEDEYTPEEIETFVNEIGINEEQFIESLKFASKEKSLILEKNRSKQLEYGEDYFANETKDNITVFLPRKAESDAIARHGMEKFFYGGRELSEEEELEKDDFLLAMGELLQNATRYGRKGSEYIALVFSRENNEAREISIMNFVNKDKEIPPEKLKLFDSCSGLFENEAEEKIKNEFIKERDDFLNNKNADFEHKRGLGLACAFCEVDFKRIENEEGNVCYKFTLRHRPEERREA